MVSHVNSYGITIKDSEMVKIFDEISDEEYEEFLGYAVKKHELEEKLKLTQKEFSLLEKNKK